MAAKAKEATTETITINQKPNASNRYMMTCTLNYNQFRAIKHLMALGGYETNDEFVRSAVLSKAATHAKNLESVFAENALVQGSMDELNF